jgi:hypothetical protein
MIVPKTSRGIEGSFEELLPIPEAGRPGNCFYCQAVRSACAWRDLGLFLG